MHQPLVGEYVLIFPTGFFSFRIRRSHRSDSLSGISLLLCILYVTYSTYVFYVDRIKHSGSHVELHTHFQLCMGREYKLKELEFECIKISLIKKNNLIEELGLLAGKTLRENDIGKLFGKKKRLSIKQY